MHLMPNEIQAENQGLESEDGMNLQEQIRQCDPTLIDSLRLVRNINPENSTAIMLEKMSQI